MAFPRCMIRQYIRRRLVHEALSAFALVCVLLSLVACMDGNTFTGPHGTPTRLPLDSTVTPTLPPIVVASGWREVFRLGEAHGNTVMTSVSFVPRTAYQILISCQGKGTVTVSFSPQGYSTFTCIDSVQLYGTPEEEAAAGQAVHISVVADSGVVWHALVQEKG